MPIPERKQNEDKQKFVQRCMSNETMKKEYPETQQRIAICLSQTRQKGKSNLIEEVHDELFANNCSWDDEWDEFVWEIEANEFYDEDGNKTRKHTSLLIWGHNPEKANVGLLVAQYAMNKKQQKDKELSEYKSKHEGLEPWEVEAKKWKY